jgi:hypothetical protein
MSSCAHASISIFLTSCIIRFASHSPWACAGFVRASLVRHFCVCHLFAAATNLDLSSFQLENVSVFGAILDQNKTGFQTGLRCAARTKTIILLDMMQVVVISLRPSMGLMGAQPEGSFRKPRKEAEPRITEANSRGRRHIWALWALLGLS